MRGKIGLAVLLGLVFLGGVSRARGQNAQMSVDYPQDLEDEKGHLVKQPVLVEWHLILTPVLRAERLEALDKDLRHAENDSDKQKAQTEIDRIRNATSIIIMTTTMSPGDRIAPRLPIGDYEIHFVPVNPPDRKPVIVRVTFTAAQASVNVQVAPEGAIIGGGPSVAELLKLIEDQQKQIAVLTERLNKLEEKNPQ